MTATDLQRGSLVAQRLCVQPARAVPVAPRGTLSTPPEQRRRPRELRRVAPDDMLARRLAAVVQQRGPERAPSVLGRARSRLLQRANDKIAVVRQPATPDGIGLAATRILEVYGAHRARKTKARVALDESHHRGVHNLEARQDDLALAAIPKVRAALGVPYKGAAAKLTWRDKEDVEPIAKAASEVLAERVADANRARAEYPKALVSAAAEVDHEVAKLASDPDLQAGVRAEVIAAIGRRWGVAPKLGALAATTRTEQFNKRFGPLIGKRKQKGRDAGAVRPRPRRPLRPALRLALAEHLRPCRAGQGEHQRRPAPEEGLRRDLARHRPQAAGGHRRRGRRSGVEPPAQEGAGGRQPLRLGHDDEAPDLRLDREVLPGPAGHRRHRPRDGAGRADRRHAPAARLQAHHEARRARSRHALQRGQRRMGAQLGRARRDAHTRGRDHRQRSTRGGRRLHWQECDGDTLRIRRHVPDIDHGQFGRFVDPRQLERERERQLDFEEYMRKRRALHQL